MADKCPNKGPGRYEGETFPCLTARFDQAPEWSDEDFTDGDDYQGETISFFKAPPPLGGFTPEYLAELSGEDAPLCADCAKGLTPPLFGVSLLIDGYGFRTLDLYPTEDEYEDAAKHAEQASLAAMADDCQCPPIGDSSDCPVHGETEA